MGKKLATLLIVTITTAAGLFALDNTTYLGLSVASSRGETLFGATVNGELLFEDNWYGLAYQASTLSNFKKDLPCLHVYGGLGASLKLEASDLFSFTLMPGISMEVDSQPIFRDGRFIAGLYTTAIAAVKLSPSFGLFVSYAAALPVYEIGKDHLEPFSLTHKASLGMAYRWDPSESDQQHYVVY